MRFKVYFIILYSFLLSLKTFAQTEVSGAVAGVWDRENSPYIVIDHITVQANNQLTIQPGVEVLFRGFFRLFVNGRINAEGTAVNRVLFTVERGNQRWNGVRLIQAQGENRFVYCRFTDSRQTVAYPDVNSHGGAIYAVTSRVIVQHCEFERNQATGQGGAAKFEDCTGEFTDNHIANNLGFTEILWFVRSEMPILRNIVENNVGDHGSGILVWSASPLVADNILRFNRSNLQRWGAGLYFVYQSNSNVVNNLLYQNNGGALYVGYGARITIDHMTLVDNIGRCGVLVVENASITATNSIFWNNENTDFWRANGNERVQLTFTNVQNAGGSQVDQTCISADPLFVNSRDGDYHLRPNSPCLNTGNPNSPPDPDGSRADMGYIYPVRDRIQADTDSLNFGIAALNLRYQIAFRIALLTFEGNIPPVDLRINIPNDVDWLTVVPDEVRIEPNDTLQFTATLHLPPNLDIGEHRSTINVFVNDEWQPRLIIPVCCFAVQGFGSIRGYAIDTESMNGIPNVAVRFSDLLQETLTDSTGFYTIDPIPAWRYRISVAQPDFLPYESAEFEIEPGQEVFRDVNLLFARCAAGQDSLIDTLRANRTGEKTLSIRNIGTGPIDYSLTPHFRENADEPWSLCQTISASEMTGDRFIYGAAFAEGNFYLSGAANERGRGRIYVLDRNGNLQRFLDQFIQSPWGIRDLTWDGELLWGIDGGRIFGFTPQGEQRATLASPLNPGRAIAWDEQRQLFWVCNVWTDILGIDRQSQILRRIPQNQELNIYGLSDFAGDTSGCTLYISAAAGIQGAQIYKVNPETGEYRLAADLQTPELLRAGGLSIMTDYDPTAWMAAVILEGVNSGPDIMNVYYMAQRNEWLAIPEPVGTIAAQSAVEVPVRFDSQGLSDGMELRGQIVIEHNGRGESLIVPVVMRVSEPAEVKRINSNLPTRLVLQSVYPNPSNNSARITFSLHQKEYIDISLIDLNGRTIKKLLTGEIQSGEHTIEFEATELSAGIYCIRMQANDKIYVSKMALIK